MNLINLTSHPKVSTIVQVMGQKVNSFVNSGNASWLQTSRQDERSSEGIEYPSGLGACLHLKAEYMTEATAASKTILLSTPGPYMTAVLVVGKVLPRTVVRESGDPG